MTVPSDDELDAAAVQAIARLDRILDREDARFGRRVRPRAEKSLLAGKTDSPPNWRQMALCRTTHVDFFDVPSMGLENQKRHARVQLAICGECPARVPCREYALETNQKHGVWGGLLPKERQRMRKRRLETV